MARSRYSGRAGTAMRRPAGSLRANTNIYLGGQGAKGFTKELMKSVNKVSHQMALMLDVG